MYPVAYVFIMRALYCMYIVNVSKLTDADHDAGVDHVRLVRGGVALDAAISPQAPFVDLIVFVARERLENLYKEQRALLHTR